MTENSTIGPSFQNESLDNDDISENCKNFFNQNYYDEEYFRYLIYYMNRNYFYYTLDETYLPETDIITEDTFLFPSIGNKPEIYKDIFGLRKKKKPGKEKTILSDKKPYFHTKNKFDNMLTKIQVGYVNFLHDFMNMIIIEKHGRKDLAFKLIDSSIKKNNKIEFRKKLKEGKIIDVLRNKISRKYTTLNENHNSEVYKELEKNDFEDVLTILEQNFLFFFESVYYNNLRKFNLKDFGLMDLEIELPKKIKLYEDLLLKNRRDKNFEEYKNKMDKCIKWHFLGGLEAEEESKGI